MVYSYHLLIQNSVSLVPIDPVTAYRITNFQVHWYWINVGIKTVGNACAHAYRAVFMLKKTSILSRSGWLNVTVVWSLEKVQIGAPSLL